MHPEETGTERLILQELLKETRISAEVHVRKQFVSAEVYTCKKAVCLSVLYHGSDYCLCGHTHTHTHTHTTQMLSPPDEEDFCTFSESFRAGAKLGRSHHYHKQINTLMQQYSNYASVIFTSLPPIPNDIILAQDFYEDMDTLSCKLRRLAKYPVVISCLPSTPGTVHIILYVQLLYATNMCLYSCPKGLFPIHTCSFF